MFLFKIVYDFLPRKTKNTDNIIKIHANTVICVILSPPNNAPTVTATTGST